MEITHDALLRAWPRLRQWIDTDRAGNLIRQELDDAAAVWNREGRDTSGLYRGSCLEAARSWTASTSHENDVSPTAVAFLAGGRSDGRAGLAGLGRWGGDLTPLGLEATAGRPALCPATPKDAEEPTSIAAAP